MQIQIILIIKMISAFIFPLHNTKNNNLECFTILAIVLKNWIFITVQNLATQIKIPGGYISRIFMNL